MGGGGIGLCGEHIQKLYGTPTKRQVVKLQVSKHPVSKRQVYLTSGFKTSSF
jgi:hypothetical protein